MKKVMPVIISSLLLLPMAGHAEGPIDGKVYGKINLGLIKTKESNNTATSKDDSTLTSNASRLGFSGKTQIEEGLSAIYQLEYEVAPQSGDAGGPGDEFKQRNSFVGLDTNYGSLIAGMHDTPLKLAQAKVDLFNDLSGADIGNYIYGEERLKNAVMYTSPSFSGVKVAVMRQFNNEEDPTQGNSGTSASVSYENGGLYLALANDTQVDDKTSNKDVTRLVAQYKRDNYMVGALYNKSQDSEKAKKEGTGYVLSAAYEIDRTTLKIQFGSSDEHNQPASNASTSAATDDQIAIGADYKLAKQTSVFVYHSTIEDDSTAKNKMVAYGLGLEHKF